MPTLVWQSSFLCLPACILSVLKFYDLDFGILLKSAAPIDISMRSSSSTLWLAIALSPPALGAYASTLLACRRRSWKILRSVIRFSILLLQIHPSSLLTDRWLIIFWSLSLPILSYGRCYLQLLIPTAPQICLSCSLGRIKLVMF